MKIKLIKMESTMLEFVFDTGRFTTTDRLCFSKPNITSTIIKKSRPKEDTLVECLIENEVFFITQTIAHEIIRGVLNYVFLEKDLLASL